MIHESGWMLMLIRLPLLLLLLGYRLQLVWRVDHRVVRLKLWLLSIRGNDPHGRRLRRILNYQLNWD
jgi:hypothetical protein